MSQAKKIYDALKESGELKILYSSMKGNWEQDKSSFIRQYEANEALINDDSVIDLDDDNEFTAGI
jgi:hypothetical protein